MTQQQNNFLNIIRAYVNGTEAQTIASTDFIESPDWNEIDKLACIHSLSGMLYITVQDHNLCSDETLFNHMAQAFMLTVGNSVNQELVLSTVLNLLNANSIHHIIFKGTVHNGGIEERLENNNKKQGRCRINRTGENVIETAVAGLKCLSCV